MIEIAMAVSILSIIILFLIFLSKKQKDSSSKKDDDNQVNSNDKYIFNKITDQRLKYIESGNIKTKKVMNIEENKIFYSMVKILNNYNINPQVSFRAFLKGEEDTETWKTFRDFYCDFLVTYKKGNKINEPIAVIEYDGAGHFGNTEDMKERIKNNDMIKELLINKAGMQYFIIKENDIKIDSKFIDDKKLEICLSDIMNSIKNDN